MKLRNFDPPSFKELETIYERLISTSVKEAVRPRFNAEQKERIISAAVGVTSHEAENAIARALIVNRTKLPGVPVEEITSEVMKVKTDVVKRSEVLEVMEADNMANVGGLANLKPWVAKRARCFGQEAQDFGIDAPEGILLAGPPGTGKSLCAKAIASTLGLPLIKFDVSRVFQSLVGQSEERVRGALKMVDALAPCVLMIDECDKASS